MLCLLENRHNNNKAKFMVCLVENRHNNNNNKAKFMNRHNNNKANFMVCLVENRHNNNKAKFMVCLVENRHNNNNNKAKFMESVRSRLVMEKVLAQVEVAAALTFDYISLVIIAAVVAGVGLAANSVVAVVASMLISPISTCTIVLCECF
ncbi:hypothetical protein SARC_00400 [Sphaeroforma arctica JP610]|uniref:Uncharacterized protein n=1 Tax=Sphaeroforma arctica JP610 TaxID=667725 RepID=A0A0L0GER6_9EUKA|nr:hypothetical protein SARC_00400 [Sphaeroforma arctica JP610]KNC87515.1 hypothetical protein SARC_00400 [Sphaeroforma arctica JP610]|eukprot:XP_014161417.1 hypothetical protein SARC_00400 [Sphaeroforma arctica JP610]